MLLIKLIVMSNYFLYLKYFCGSWNRLYLSRWSWNGNVWEPLIYISPQVTLTRNYASNHRSRAAVSTTPLRNAICKCSLELFFGIAGSLNSVANDGTCDHHFLATLLGKASQVNSSWLFLHPGGFLSSTFNSFWSVFLICLFSTSLICGLSCCPGLFTISLSLNAENHLAVFEMPAAAAYLCFLFYFLFNSCQQHGL